MESGVWDLAPGAWDLRPGSGHCVLASGFNLGSGIWDPEPGTRDMAPGILGQENSKIPLAPGPRLDEPRPDQATHPERQAAKQTNIHAYRFHCGTSRKREGPGQGLGQTLGPPPQRKHGCVPDLLNNVWLLGFGGYCISQRNMDIILYLAYYFKT